MASTETTNLDDVPRLLQLPLELRQEIYSYLCPESSLSYPIPILNITSVSHRPPSTGLLRVSKAIYQDITDHYYSHAVWKFPISHAFNFYRIDPTLSNLASSRLLKRIQRIELVLFIDGSLLKEYPSFGKKNLYEEIGRRATRACEVLATAPRLDSVRVSWIDSTTSGSIEDKMKVLQPLRLLEGKCRFEIGECRWLGAADDEAFVRRTVKSAVDANHLVTAC